MVSWINALINLDRMICVMYVNNVKFIKNKYILSCIVLAIFTIISLIDVPNLFYNITTISTFENSTNQTMSKSECSSTNLIMTLRDFLGISIRVLIPFLSYAFMNTILIYKLFKSRNSVQTITNRSFEREYKFTFTIIILNILFILTETPFIISLIFMNKYGYNQTFIDALSNESAIAMLAHVCSYVFSSFFYVTLFFVNFSTNKIFRKCFWKLLKYFL
jgi:hypothetical protein